MVLCSASQAAAAGRTCAVHQQQNITPSPLCQQHVHWQHNPLQPAKQLQAEVLLAFNHLDCCNPRSNGNQHQPCPAAACVDGAPTGLAVEAASPLVSSRSDPAAYPASTCIHSWGRGRQVQQQQRAQANMHPAVVAQHRCAAVAMASSSIVADTLQQHQHKQSAWQAVKGDSHTAAGAAKGVVLAGKPDRPAAQLLFRLGQQQGQPGHVQQQNQPQHTIQGWTQLNEVSNCPSWDSSSADQCKPQPPTKLKLSDLLAQHQTNQQQQQVKKQQQQRGIAEPVALDGERLDRKLTAVLSDSCSSWRDVADVLLAAESAGRLNALHTAAALSTLARLAAAQRAAAAAAADSPAVYSQYAMVAVVSLNARGSKELAVVKQAAAVAAARGSRWHLPAAAAAAYHASSAMQQLSKMHSQLAAAGGQQDVVGVAYEPHASLLSDEQAQEHEQDQEQHLLDQLTATVQEFWPAMSAATITSCCWSLAVLGQVLPEPLLPQLAATLQGMAHCLQQAAQDGSSNSISSTSNICSEQGSQGMQYAGVTPRQVVTVLWSLAKMQIGFDDLQLQLIVSRQQPVQHAHAVHGSSLADGANASEQQQLTGAVHVVAASLVPFLPQLSSQSLSMMLWALATWRYPLQPAQSTALLTATAAAIQPQQCMTPQGLAVSLWGIVRLGLAPDADWLAAWLTSMRAQLPLCSSHDLSVSVWALAVLGLPPPGEWLLALSCQAAEQAYSLKPAELPALLWGLARLRYRPPLLVMQQLLQRGQRLARSDELSPQGLALLLWSTSALGFLPTSNWVDSILAAAAHYLPLFRPIEASALMVGLVRLKHIPHQSWMDAWWEGTVDLLPDADGQQLVLLLWCSVRLGQAPPRWWFDTWQQYSSAAMAAGLMTAQGYGLMWHALQQLEAAPSNDWLAAYWQASIQPDVVQAVECQTAEHTLCGLAVVSQQLGGLMLPLAWTNSFLEASGRQLWHANLLNISNMLQAAGQLELWLSCSWLDAAMARLATLLAAQELVTWQASSNNKSSSTKYSSKSSSSTSRSSLGKRIGVMTSEGREGQQLHRRSLGLAARLQRRWLAMCLRKVLEGLRAQHMLTAAARGQQRYMQYMQQEQQQASMLGSKLSAGVVAAFQQPDGVPAAHSLPGNATASAQTLHKAAAANPLDQWPWLRQAVYNAWPNRHSAAQALQALTGRSEQE